MASSTANKGYGLNISKASAWLVNSKAGKLLTAVPYAIYNSIIMALSPIPRRTADSRKTVFIMIHALSGGGAERVAGMIASGLAEKYHTVAVCISRRPDEYNISDKVERINIPQFKGFERMLVFFRFLYMRRLKKKRDPVLSISFLYSMNRYNVPTKYHDTVVLCERNNPFKNESRIIDRIKKLYYKADYVVFQTEEVRDLFEENIKSHSTILPNPIYTACERADTTEHKIVNIGRLTQQKNQKMLIRAFSRFVTIHPNYTLSIYGDGVVRGELNELISSLGLNDKVFLVGRIPDVHNAVRDAEMFVLSSDYEGMPNALLECMLMGFACISTACEGARDLIKSGENGILISVGCEEELVNAMCMLAENEQLRERLGRNAKASAEQYRYDNVMKKWAKFVDRLVSEGSEEQYEG